MKPPRLNSIKFFLGFLAIGLAIGFLRYFGRWVYFPWFPNVLDSVAMGAIGAYLLYEVVAEVEKKGRALLQDPNERDSVTA
ncbi:MAG: hypothetical protein ABSB26_03780 [Nitrososphaerales archaeon]|jgi:hypothetical protein